LIVAGALLALVGCTCDREPESPQRRGAVKKPVAQKGTKPLPSLKDQMRTMQRFAEELRRRVRGDLPVAGPAKVIRSTLKSLPVNRYPKNFKIFYNAMLARTEALIKTRKLGHDYDKFVDRCIACHALQAQDYMGMVKRLKVPKAQWPRPAE